MCQCLQGVHTKLVRKGIDPCMLQKLVAGLIQFRHCGVFDQSTLSGDLLWEVFSCIKILQEAANSIKVLFRKVNG